MRPEILFSLFADIKTLSGVGPKIREHLARLTGPRIVNLLWHLPVGFIDRTYMPNVEDAQAGRIATLKVLVGKHQKPPTRLVPYRVECFDDTGKITLVFFHAHEKYLLDNLPEGKEVLVSGTVEKFKNNTQMTHPDYILPNDKADELPKIEPIYPLTAGLASKRIQKTIGDAMAKVPELPEWLDEAHKVREKWTSWNEALIQAHAPKSQNDLSPLSPHRMRLAYDELLANQLALGLVREKVKKNKGRAIKGSNHLREKIIAGLPFKLTNSQNMTLAEMDGDMQSPNAMLRLVQGDVGSGKTIVAFLALISAIECGFQAAFLAPTEILARQHFSSLSKMTKGTDIRIDILTGRNKGKARDEKLARLKAGEIDLLIGTHALFQEDVDYNNLGAVVVDEQHRFGVHQRLALSKKSSITPDVLVMTATPIPRTLTLTIYGDMDVSRITEKPIGRLPITTRIMGDDKIAVIADGLKRAIEKGERAYWVCPLVEESEVLDVAAAEDRFKYLQKIFGDKVGLVHGKMKPKEKDAAMAAFEEGTVQILVATTVIEVGVDVKEATIIVIEHAERFGLAQLHQLRGRVGRGDKASSCLLVRARELTATAKARLKILRETEDGFLIAEEDLKLRGAGEILGTRQSGFPEFHVADMSVHGDLLATARDDARLILATDPELDGWKAQFEEGKIKKDQHISKKKKADALRVLLYLFERDDGVKLLRGG